jgi:3',5'-cyclic-AMP phosphodiesterase
MICTMPLIIPPISRRRFLASSLAAGAATVLPRWSRGSEAPSDPHHFALLSDIHLSGNPDFVHKTGVNPLEGFTQARDEVLGLPTRPAGVFVNGDCACLKGLPEDYAIFAQAILPVRTAGMPLYITMGNHDDRDNFWAGLPADESRMADVTDRQITSIAAERANFFMLDSLAETAMTPGFLGTNQLAWLGRALDAHGDKPALIFVHHQPDVRPKVQGLLDTPALYEVLLPRKQVKALIFGHTHDWHFFKTEDLHCVNLPATAWVFQEGQPRGWVDLHLGENGATFELRCLDRNHPSHGQTLRAEWRTG